MKQTRTISELNKSAQNEIDAAIKEMDASARRRLQESDRFHTERLCERYRHLVPAETIRKVKDLPTIFENEKDFERSRREAGLVEPGDGRKVVGFYPRNFKSPHVNMDAPEAEETAIHERVHEISHPRADKILGTELVEGITEDLAIRELGHEPANPSGYAEERAAAQKLAQRFGDDTLERTLLTGDAREFYTRLDQCLGKENLGNLENLEDKATADASQESTENDDGD